MKLRLYLTKSNFSHVQWYWHHCKLLYIQSENAVFIFSTSKENLHSCFNIFFNTPTKWSHNFLKIYFLVINRNWRQEQFHSCTSQARVVTLLHKRKTNNLWLYNATISRTKSKSNQPAVPGLSFVTELPPCCLNWID